MREGFMLVEKLITYVARRKNESYLQFSSPAIPEVTRQTSNTPALLYVHIPFCEELCPYCSFNRVVFREDIARLYFEALRKEIIMYRELGYAFEGLYVGGGTPTVLIDELAAILALIKQTYPVKEISVETNPNHLTEANLRILKASGVNRLSVGVQTFDNDLLKAIERFHKYGSGEEIGERIRTTQGIFQTLNIDMIFNFPLQTLAILEKDLSTLVNLGVDQITYYPLMVSTSTEAAMKRKLGVVDYDRGRSFYEMIIAMLSPHYRPSTAWCFSRSEAPIDEYVVNYEEYAGLGSGSIGYLGGIAYANTFDIMEYIAKINNGIMPITGKKVFSLKERLRYDFLMKLFGMTLDLRYLAARYGTSIYKYLWPEITFFLLVGGLRKQGGVLSLTKKGRYYWVLMMREFFIGVNNFRDFCRAELQGKN
jgi:coproporphyrinogen III oxidase-like Fe-S oxidoreductase